MFENSSFIKKNSNEPGTSQSFHPDLDKNRQYAKTFIDRVSGHLVEGLSLSLVDHGGAKESLLWVKFSVPNGIAEADYAHPISLNSPYSQVQASVDWTFNHFHKRGKSFWERRGKSKIVDLKKAG